MEDTRDSLRRVQFPEAGAGVYLHLRNSGAKILHAQYGANYFQIVEAGLNICDMDIIEKILELALCNADGTKFKPTNGLDHFDNVTLEFLQTKLLDAFSQAANGRTYKDQLEYLNAQAVKDVVAKENPPTAPEVTSSTSNSGPTEQDSGQESSTISA